jgi:hypothetical protein
MELTRGILAEWVAGLAHGFDRLEAWCGPAVAWAVAAGLVVALLPLALLVLLLSPGARQPHAAAPLLGRAPARRRTPLGSQAA